jgi:hypothetical protein
LLHFRSLLADYVNILVFGVHIILFAGVALQVFGRLQALYQQAVLFQALLIVLDAVAQLGYLETQTNHPDKLVAYDNHTCQKYQRTQNLGTQRQLTYFLS